MRVGTLCYATEQGLGRLAKSFFDHGVVTDPLIVRHSVHENQFDWYPNAHIINNVRDIDGIWDHIKSLDVMLFFETPFNWALIYRCKEAGIKTVMMPMHECMPMGWPDQPDIMGWPAKPDIVINPSLLDHDCFPDGVYIPVPVEMPWKQRTVAYTFVHNAGHGGLKGRNGTAELMEACNYIESPANIIIRSQSLKTPEGGFPKLKNGKFKYQAGTRPFDTLYSEGDVFVFPEKFNGLSLPLQEAYASGMIVMATDRFPMNDWLPKEPLIRTSGSTLSRIGPPYRIFSEALIDPKEIAAKIDEWYGRDLTYLSGMGWVWAESMSWEKLKPQYMEVLS